MNLFENICLGTPLITLILPHLGVQDLLTLTWTHPEFTPWARAECVARRFSNSSELILTKCGLRVVTPEISKLAHLHKLCLNHNALEEFPLAICDLTCLSYLSLSFNRIGKLPCEVGRLTRLQSLHLASNQISALPGEVSQLTLLRILNVSRNQLRELPDTLHHLQHLKYFSAHHNPLEHAADLDKGAVRGPFETPLK